MAMNGTCDPKNGTDECDDTRGQGALSQDTGKKLVRRYPFIMEEEIPLMETYLSDMSKQGLHFVRRGWLFMCFERGEPKDLAYQVDLSNPFANPEYLRTCKEKGWEFVWSRAGDNVDIKDNYSIFRAPRSEQTMDLYAEPAEQARTMDLYAEPAERARTMEPRLKSCGKRTIIWTLCIIALLGLVGSSLFLNLFANPTPLLSFIHGEYFWMLAACIVWGYFISVQYSIYLKLRRMKKTTGSRTAHRIHRRLEEAAKTSFYP